MVMIFRFPISLSTFCLFPKVQKEIIVIIGGPEQEKYYYRWINRQRLCCYRNFREVTLEAKNKVSSNYFEKPLLFSELLLEGRKKTIR
jgi:hypothetical protein